MNPDDLDRRDVVKSLALLPLSASAATDSRKFFSAAEWELVATLAELILPQTETPGARAARVHQHLDLVLSEETEEVRREFRDGLAWVERRSRDLHKLGFVALGAEQQNAILAGMADSKAENDPGRRFFRDLRKRVVFAYYTSEIGLRQELGYRGKQALGHWEGCPHPGHHGDSAD